jgi:hypothetical protein
MDATLREFILVTFSIVHPAAATQRAQAHVAPACAEILFIFFFAASISRHAANCT